MNGVIEEKSNRIVEIIVSSAKPFQLMMVKFRYCSGGSYSIFPLGSATVGIVGHRQQVRRYSTRWT